MEILNAVGNPSFDDVFLFFGTIIFFIATRRTFQLHADTKCPRRSLPGEYYVGNFTSLLLGYHCDGLHYAPLGKKHMLRRGLLLRISQTFMRIVNCN